MISGDSAMPEASGDPRGSGSGSVGEDKMSGSSAATPMQSGSLDPLTDAPSSEFPVSLLYLTVDAAPDMLVPSALEDIRAGLVRHLSQYTPVTEENVQVKLFSGSVILEVTITIPPSSSANKYDSASLADQLATDISSRSLSTVGSGYAPSELCHVRNTRCTLCFASVVGSAAMIFSAAGIRRSQWLASLRLSPSMSARYRSRRSCRSRGKFSLHQRHRHSCLGHHRHSCLGHHRHSCLGHHRRSCLGHRRRSRFHGRLLHRTRPVQKPSPLCKQSPSNRHQLLQAAPPRLFRSLRECSALSRPSLLPLPGLSCSENCGALRLRDRASRAKPSPTRRLELR
jgi:hypothetical protein